MKKKILGNTGLQVSELGLGLGGLFASPDKKLQDQGIATVAHAINKGINAFDMAAGYAGSEAGLGRALEGVDRDSGGEPFILTTKLGQRITDGKPQPFDPKDKKEM